MAPGYLLVPSQVLLGNEFPDDLALGKSTINMRSFCHQMSMGLLGSHLAIGDEPAEYDRGATAAARFTMDIDFLSLSDLLIHELHGLSRCGRG